MNDSSPPNDTGRARRLIVTLLVGTAAAAVTAGVAINERRPGETGVERAGASAALAPTRAVADPSLPAAAEALKGGAGSSAEDVSTF